jgi:hypothetical protein
MVEILGAQTPTWPRGKAVFPLWTVDGTKDLRSCEAMEEGTCQGICQWKDIDAMISSVSLRLHHVRTHVIVAVCKQRRGPLLGTESASTLILDLIQHPELWEENVCCVSYPIYSILLRQPELSYWWKGDLWMLNPLRKAGEHSSDKGHDLPQVWSRLEKTSSLCPKQGPLIGARGLGAVNRRASFLFMKEPKIQCLT